MTAKILIVDDDPEMCRMLERALGAYQTTSRHAAVEALEALEAESFDAVITDLRMPGMTGIELCKQIVTHTIGVPVIVITAFGSIEIAIEATRSGAYDFITKPFNLEAIRATVRRALEHHALARRVERLERTLRHDREFEGIIGGSEAMRELFGLIERFAASDAGVLVVGESGTGKELVARALHRRSRRKSGSIVAVNCAALPEALLEAELFGYVKGAFTDAKTDRSGLFLEADGGTLFLDEIGELPLGLQPKLLRALQERRVRPIGSKIEIEFDARIVAATNRDLETEVEQGRFREDLFYRLNVLQLEVPPLRERATDILLLAHRFAAHFASLMNIAAPRFRADAAEHLLGYSWPGNVRELQNYMERAVVLSSGGEISAEDLPKKVTRSDIDAPVLGEDLSTWPPADEIERRYVLKVYDAARGNKSLAAQILGYNRKTLYRKLRAYGVLRDAAVAPEAASEEAAASTEPPGEG